MTEPQTPKRRSPTAILRELSLDHRGRFKIYIGMAPGVGKTCKMLTEAHQLKSQGVDVMIGVLETHGRTETQAMVGDLPMIPKRKIDYKGVLLEEMDTEAILARKPQTVLVDELAHTNVPTSDRAKRYMDVEIILQAGINVISTVNIQHLESLNDIISRITGVTVRETLPDNVLEKANQVVLVDITPEELRQRLEEGKVYAPEKINQALQSFFRVNNLAALRELALREIADTVDVQIPVVARQGLQERIMVGLTSSPTSARLIRRGGRLAQRLNAEWFVVHIRTQPPTRQEEQVLADLFRLATEQGAKVISLNRPNGRVDDELVRFANQHDVTQIVLGETRKTWWQRVLQGSIIRNIINQTRNIDILIVAEGRND